jgi:cobalt-precorrin 5A hydrolase
MIVAGLGCRSGATPDAVAEAFAAALERCGVARREIDALATDAAKSSERGIVAFAAALELPLIYVAAEEMAGCASGAVTSSPRVIALKGVPSIAETAALAAAGRGARLLAPRTATATVTCAIAIGQGGGSNMMAPP